MEKIFRIISSIMIILSVIFIMMLVFFRVAFPPSTIKTMIESYAKNELDREVSFDEISFRIIGADLHNFALSETGGFGNGTFLKTKRLSFKARLIPLLKKEIYIYRIETEELYAEIIKKDGKYNVFGYKGFLPLIDAEKNKSRKVNFAVSDIRVRKSQIQFFNGDDNSICTVSDISCFVRNLQLMSRFETKLKFDFLYRKGMKEISIPFEGSLFINLKNMNIFQAYAELKPLNFRYNGTQFFLEARASNFIDPEINISAEADVFTNETLKDFISSKSVYKFNKVKLYTDFRADLREKVLFFDKANLSSGKSMAKSQGYFYYGKDKKDFDFEQIMSFDIEEILNSFEKHSEKIVYGGTFNAKAKLIPEKMTVDARSDDLMIDLKTAGILFDGFSGRSVFDVNFPSGEINFLNLDFFLYNSTITASGTYKYKQQKDYVFSGKAIIDAKNASAPFNKYAKDFFQEGSSEAAFKINNDGAKGIVLFKDINLKKFSAFSFSDLRGQLEFNSFDNITISSLTGMLNGEKFTLSSSYSKELQNINLSVNAKAVKFYLPDFPDIYIDAPSNIMPAAANNDIPYILNLDMTARAETAELPHMSCGPVNIKIGLKEITKGYDRIKGSLSFNSGKVMIDDLEKLINKNSFTKTAFHALGITYKTAKEMNVKIFDENTKSKEETAVGLKFSSSAARAEFVPGFVNLKNFKLASSGSSINMTGDIDLQTKALNMRISADPLFGNTIIIKVDGTIDEPKTSGNQPQNVFITAADALLNEGSVLYDAANYSNKEETSGN